MSRRATEQFFFGMSDLCVNKRDEVHDDVDTPSRVDYLSCSVYCPDFLSLHVTACELAERDCKLIAFWAGCIGTEYDGPCWHHLPYFGILVLP
jgi:hypothetical protein